MQFKNGVLFRQREMEKSESVIKENLRQNKWTTKNESVAPASSKSFQRVIGVLSRPEMRHINFRQCPPESPAWLHHQIEIMDFVWKGHGCVKPQREWGHQGTESFHRQMCIHTVSSHLMCTVYTVIELVRHKWCRVTFTLQFVLIHFQENILLLEFNIIWINLVILRVRWM